MCQPSEKGKDGETNEADLLKAMTEAEIRTALAGDPDRPLLFRHPPRNGVTRMGLCRELLRRTGGGRCEICGNPFSGTDDPPVGTNRCDHFLHKSCAEECLNELGRRCPICQLII